jgi:DNA-binding NtrC family response regulator
MTARTMLVVDDEPAICELIAEVARAEGYDVAQGSTAAEVDRLVAVPHDVTVLDLDLGRSADDDVLRALAVRSPGAQVVFVSGADASTVVDAHRRAASYGLRVVGSCAKPFDLTTFRRVLSRIAVAV